MIDIKDLKFKYNLEELYNNVSIRILKNEHIVLIGPNGSGKSTFLKLVAKELTPDSGSITYEPNIKIGYLDQYMKLNPEMIVKDYLYDVFTELFNKEEEMNNLYNKIATNNLNENEVNKLLNYAQSIQDYLLDKDFYLIKSLISNIINGLGLNIEVLNKKIKHLSSGMRSKIILGKLLLEENDLILLDEPTNFLDKSHIDWLTKFLNEYDGAFIVVTHDEVFAKDIARVIFDLNNKVINRYNGNFDFYLKESKIRNEHYDKEYEAQQRLIKATTEFINKNITRASTSKRAKSRRKMLEKIEVIEKRKEPLSYTFSFPIKLRTGKEVLKVLNLEIGYNNQSLIEPISFTIRNEEKVAITGYNGVGKSTLIKTVLEEIPKISGEFKWDKNAKFNYLAQDDFYLINDSAFAVTNNVYYNFDKTDIYSLLASYGIDYEKANRPINTLSGGEQMKIKLALMKNNYGNVLILDEPTNHLDVNAKEALKDALKTYEGTLILVSHDHEFYGEICDYEISLF